jgi:hypothetical protein
MLPSFATERAMMLRIAADYDALAERASSMTQGFTLAQNVILDRETRKSVALIRNGQVFRDDREGAKIATVIGSYLYDVNGNLVGHLDGDSVVDPSTESMPIAFRKLLKGGC